MLTKKQAELLAFVRAYQAGNDGVSPSFVEMADAIGVASKSGVMRLLDALEERGFIRRLRNRVRAIEVLDPAGPINPDVVAAKIIERARHEVRLYKEGGESFGFDRLHQLIVEILTQ